jgi:hypothetical protein
MRTPLLDLAERNHATLSARFSSAGSVVHGVASPLESGRVSVNMKHLRIRAFLSKGVDRNAKARARERAAATGRPADELLRESEKAYYARRVAFEALADPGEFSYGALNAGGLGAPYYGAFCVVFQAGPASCSAYAPIWLEQDSLQGPWWSGDTLDTVRLTPATATPPAGHHLAALKLCPGGVAPADPARALCDGTYVEAVSPRDPTLTDVMEVRFPEPEAAEIERRALAGVVSPDLTALPDFAGYAAIRDELERLGIPLVEVAA